MRKSTLGRWVAKVALAATIGVIAAAGSGVALGSPEVMANSDVSWQLAETVAVRTADVSWQ